MTKWLKVLVLSSSIVALAACSSNKAVAPQSPNAPQSAQAYGLGEKGGLNGTDVGVNGPNGSRHVNALTAPATQVYYFGYNNSNVDPSDLKAIKIQAEYLRSHSNAKVRLEGNTDDRGSREYNVALGDRRARAVAQIIKQEGVKANQISIVSYGKERPAVVGNSEASRSLNRRVVLVYVRQ